MYFLIQIVDVSFDVFYWLMISRVLLSWIAPGAGNKVVDFVIDVTDVILVPVKRIFPTMIGGIDFSPIIVIFLLSFVRRIVMQLLYSLAF